MNEEDLNKEVASFADAVAEHCNRLERMVQQSGVGTEEANAMIEEVMEYAIEELAAAAKRSAWSEVLRRTAPIVAAAMTRAIADKECSG